MNLVNVVDERLWTAVRSSYESGNYSGAITDSVFYLSELIRNKSGLDSDGAPLAGSALGGESLIIKVNPFHTESDRNEQRGVEQLVRGLYTGIRNPRSHEKRTDSVETADVIIAFVGWVAGLIDKSKSPFDTEQIIANVFDQHFAQNERYAELLVSRIPARKRLEALIEVFQRRTEATKIDSVKLFAKSVLATLTPEEQDQFWQVVSECLENASEDEEFRSVIKTVGSEWGCINEFARLRAEHCLIESIKRGKLIEGAKHSQDGALGTWAINIAKDFASKDQLTAVLISKLYSQSPDERRYLYRYLFATLQELRPEITEAIRLRLENLLKKQDLETFEALRWMGDDWPDVLEDNKWVLALRDAVKTFVPRTAEEIADDDIPF